VTSFLFELLVTVKIGRGQTSGIHWARLNTPITF
jgi:hypothetical protein